MPNLFSLPEEIFCKISGFIHPQTIIDWACTCKVLSRCSLQALQTHRKYRSELRVVQNRNPMTIPLLLRSSLSQPELLWYLRSLDIWWLREEFQEWKSPVFSDGNPYGWNSPEYLNWPEKPYDCSHVDSKLYTDEELKRYRSMLSDLLCIKGSLVDKWMQRLQSGSDEILKVLLMALSPRLNKVTFIQYTRPQAEPRSHPLRLFASTLRALAPLPCLQWPCFQNIKTVVFVGQCTDLSHAYDAYQPHSRDIAPLFLLPAIKDLYFNLLVGEENDPESDLDNDEEYAKIPVPYVWEWDVGRSSCQNLTFCACDLSPRTIASFIGATHSLRSINGLTNKGTIVSALLEHSKHSLETVNFDGTRNDVLSPPSLQPFGKLTHIILPARQLIDMSNYKRPQFVYTAEHAIDTEKTDFGIMTWIELSTYLPAKLLNQGSFLINPTAHLVPLSEIHAISQHQIGDIADHLVSLVNAKLFSSNGNFAFLTGLCIANLNVTDTKLPWLSDERNWLDPWLGELKRVCEEAKVRIHIPGGGMWPEGSCGDLNHCSSCEGVDH